MKVTTLRLPESMYDSLEAEAEAEEKSVSEYVRDVLRERENTRPNTTESDDRIGSLEQRVDELEQRVTDLEPTADGPDATPEIADSGTGNEGRDPHPSAGENGGLESSDPGEVAEAAVQWLRDRDEPASRSEILEAVLPGEDVLHIKPDSFWRRHGRPALEEAGFEYTRNVGWHREEGHGKGGVYDPTEEF